MSGYSSSSGTSRPRLLSFKAAVDGIGAEVPSTSDGEPRGAPASLRRRLVDRCLTRPRSAEAVFAKHFVHPETAPRRAIPAAPLPENVYSFTYGPVRAIVFNNNYWYSSAPAGYGGAPEGTSSTTSSRGSRRAGEGREGPGDPLRHPHRPGARLPQRRPPRRRHVAWRERHREGPRLQGREGLRREGRGGGPSGTGSWRRSAGAGRWRRSSPATSTPTTGRSSAPASPSATPPGTTRTRTGRSTARRRGAARGARAQHLVHRERRRRGPLPLGAGHAMEHLLEGAAAVPVGDDGVPATPRRSTSSSSRRRARRSPCGSSTSTARPSTRSRTSWGTRGTCTGRGSSEELMVNGLMVNGTDGGREDGSQVSVIAGSFELPRIGQDLGNTQKQTINHRLSPPLHPLHDLRPQPLRGGDAEEEALGPGPADQLPRAPRSQRSIRTDFPAARMRSMRGSHWRMGLSAPIPWTHWIAATSGIAKDAVE